MSNLGLKVTWKIRIGMWKTFVSIAINTFATIKHNVGHHSSLHITTLGIVLHFTNMPLKKTIICPYFGTKYKMIINYPCKFVCRGEDGEGNNNEGDNNTDINNNNSGIHLLHSWARSMGMILLVEEDWQLCHSYFHDWARHSKEAIKR